MNKPVKKDISRGIRGVYSIPDAKPVTKRDGSIRYWVHNATYINKSKKRKYLDSAEFLTPDEAIQDAKDKINKKINEGVIPMIDKSANTTIGDLLSLYYDYVENKSLDETSAGTKDTDLNKANTIINITKKLHVYNMTLSELDADEMTVWLNGIREAKYEVKRNVKNEETGEIEKKVVEVKKYSPDSYRDFKTHIKKALKYANDNNYFYKATTRYNSLVNTIDVDETPKKPKKTQEEKERSFRYFTFDEFLIFSAYTLYSNVAKDTKLMRKLIIDYCDNGKIDLTYSCYRDYKYFVYYSCLYFLGLRNEECRVLLRKDVKLATKEREGRVDINKALSGHHRKKDRDEYYRKQNLKNENSDRMVPVHPRLNRILIDYFDYMEDNNLFGPKGIIFPGAKGKYISDNAINKKINTVMKNMSPELQERGFSKHDFRRSCAMWLCYKKNIPLYRAFRFFGHVDSTMLIEVYTFRMKLEEEQQTSKDFAEVHFFDSDDFGKYDFEGNYTLDETIKPKLSTNDSQLEDYYARYSVFGLEEKQRKFSKKPQGSINGVKIKKH